MMRLSGDEFKAYSMNWMNRCEECARLESEVTAALQRLTEITTAQLDAFRAKDNAAVVRLDKELEHAVGVKERALGAQREHARDHSKSLQKEP